MARGLHLLSAPAVKNARTPGRVHDGGGLYLQVTAQPPREGEPPGVTRSWLFMYRMPGGDGARREMGLGSAEIVTLASARAAADAARALVKAGIDPIAQRKADRAAAALAAAKAMTFKEAAGAYIEAKAPSWKHPKHRKLWATSLERYAYPKLGAVGVAAVDVGLVLQVLEPIWTEKPETAAKVRQRIEAVLDWAAARGLRGRDNPARWRDHMQHLLPARSQPVKHHAALPFVQVAAFAGDLRKQGGSAALALELCILTATRTTETLGARWAEIDLDGAVWTIPASRMKSKREHRVPLSRQAVKLLRRMRAADPKGKLVFPGLGTKRPLSGMAMLKVLERMKRTDITVHGFRSTFRDWAGESTNYPSDVAEAALAHSTKGKTVAAYARGDLFEKRRRLMQAWADYCDRAPTAGSVIGLKRRREAEA